MLDADVHKPSEREFVHVALPQVHGYTSLTADPGIVTAGLCMDSCATRCALVPPNPNEERPHLPACRCSKAHIDV